MLLKTFMIVNFKSHKISRDTRKLTRTFILKKKNLKSSPRKQSISQDKKGKIKQIVRNLIQHLIN